MALGSGYQGGNTNQNQNKVYEPNYYSRLRFRNSVDNLVLNFTFWSGTLKVSISEAGNAQEGRNNELASIYLSPTKARLLADGVGRIINDPETFDIYGVDTGSGEVHGFIAIGREMGKPYLFIAKVDGKGNYESSQRFQFNFDYNYLLKIHELTKLKCQKEYANNLELEQFKDLLEDFSRYASGAAGAMMYDTGRYEAAKSSNMIRAIAQKIGASTGNYNNANRGSNSFFSGADSEYDEPSSRSGESRKSTFESINELEDELNG